MPVRVPCLPDSCGARSALKLATDSIHQQMHEHRVLKRIVGGQVSTSEYAGLLECFYAFLSSARDVEVAASVEMGDHASGEQCRWRLDALLADMRGLNREPIRGDVRLTPSSLAGWNVGYAYVVRGSVTGGRVMHKALDRAEEPIRGARTFLGGQPGDGSRWRTFCDALDRHTTCRSDLYAMVEGAKSAFADFGTCLEQAGL